MAVARPRLLQQSGALLVARHRLEERVAHTVIEILLGQIDCDLVQLLIDLV